MLSKIKVLVIFLLLTVFGMSAIAREFSNQEIVEFKQKYDAENTAVLSLQYGDVLIRMYPDKAPNHVSRIKELIRNRFYDGLKFHRVIPDFMAQTGDPSGDGTGGSGIKLKAEFNDLKHVRGTVSMARSRSVDSADSQFFICFENSPHLDGKYTIWGQVVSGMEYVDRIKKGDVYNGRVALPDRIIKFRMLSDL